MVPEGQFMAENDMSWRKEARELRIIIGRRPARLACLAGGWALLSWRAVDKPRNTQLNLNRIIAFLDRKEAWSLFKDAELLFLFSDLIYREERALRIILQ